MARYNTKDIFAITFKVNRIRLDNPDSFFKIFEAVIQKQANNTVKKEDYLKQKEIVYAHVPYLGEGDVFTGTAEVCYNPKYGYYLQILGEPELVLPETHAEMQKFLVKRIPGVGIKTAEKLMDAYGMDVLSIMASDSNALSFVGIVGPKAEKIMKEVGKYSSYEKLIAFLSGMNIPVRIATQIFEKLGHQSVRSIQANPYELVDVNPEYFQFADIIANTLNKNPLAPERITAGILAYIENRSGSYGDICVPEATLYKHIKRFIYNIGDFSYDENMKMRKTHIQQGMKTLVKHKQVVIDLNKESVSHVYLTRLHHVENRIVSNLKTILMEFRTPIACTDAITQYIANLERGAYLSEDDRIAGVKPFALAENQRKAVFMALTHNISILTGGPGTGKTATVNTTVQALKYANPQASIALLAPTGKAAKRMSELTHMEAFTIHRKLKLAGYGTGGGVEKIEEDFVVVDESSMVDAELFDVLLNNLGENTRVLIVGDVDQLPSIGAGLILRDLIDSGVVPVTKLNEIFRQAQDSQIIMNAHKLNSGVTTKHKDGLSFDHSKGDMYFVKTSDEVNIKRKIVEAFRRQVEVYHHPLEDVTILSPMRVGGLGTIELNALIQSAINPRKGNEYEVKVMKETEITFRERDRVMHLTNDVDKNITNGEMGFITRIYDGTVEKENGTVVSTQMVDVAYQDFIFGDRVVSYTSDEVVDELELAYAISIHKSQGSEFPVMLMPFHESQQHMLQRNLIYTAWTRAKSMIVNIGDMKCLDAGIQKIDNIDRISLLKEKLQINLKKIA